jgi:hypothetical protein
MKASNRESRVRNIPMKRYFPVIYRFYSLVENYCVTTAQYFIGVLLMLDTVKSSNPTNYNQAYLN